MTYCDAALLIEIFLDERFMDKLPNLEVVIRHETSGAESRRLVAQICADGSLMLEGWEAGDRVESFFGDRDYEYWLTIAAADKDRLLLLLIQHQFQTQLPTVQEWRQWAEAHGIPVTYTGY